MNFLLWIAFFLLVAWIFKDIRSMSDSAKQKIKRKTQQKKSPSDDAYEGSFYEASKQRTTRKPIILRYVDAGGSYTERRVDLYTYEPNNPRGLLGGMCHLRGEWRTFRFDRIKEAVLMETGEIVKDLQAALNAEWAASPEPVVDKLLSEHRDILKLMFFMAKADGAARKAEIEIIAAQCRELTGDDRLTTTMIKDMLRLLDVPTLQGFTKAYEILCNQQPALASRAADACWAIVATQKTIHPNEQAALDVLAGGDTKPMGL